MEALIKKFKKQSTQTIIRRLEKLEGDDLKAARQVLVERGALGSEDEGTLIQPIRKDMEIGDRVTFEAAKNSKHKGKTFEGIIVRNRNKDPRTGKRYFVIKVEGYGLFHKQQSSVMKMDIDE